MGEDAGLRAAIIEQLERINAAQQRWCGPEGGGGDPETRREKDKA